MLNEPPVHVFDRARGRVYPPNPAFAKTAILIDITDESATTELNTEFGVQRVRGPFYVVAEGAGSYGASKKEFEQSHVAVDATRWMRSEPVLAYVTDERCTVKTYLGGGEEASVVAEPGDWIVQQPTGEVMVVVDRSFRDRYLVDVDEDASDAEGFETARSGHELTESPTATDPGSG